MLVKISGLRGSMLVNNDSPADRAFWVVLRQLWSRWTEALVTVKPETAIFTSATRQSRPVCRDLAARPLRVRPCRAMPIGGDSR